MKKAMFFLASLMVLICSCGVPEKNVPVYEYGPQKVQADTIPTIEMGGTDTIQVETVSLYPITTLSIDKGEIIILDSVGDEVFRRTGDINSVSNISLDVRNGNIIGMAVNKEVKAEYKAPFKMLGNGRVKILPGGNLSLMARYYNTSVKKLMICNNLDNPDQIRVGDVLKLNCNCKCE